MEMRKFKVHVQTSGIWQAASEQFPFSVQMHPAYWLETRGLQAALDTNKTSAVYRF